MAYDPNNVSFGTSPNPYAGTKRTDSVFGADNPDGNYYLYAPGEAGRGNLGQKHHQNPSEVYKPNVRELYSRISDASVVDNGYLYEHRSLS